MTGFAILGASEDHKSGLTPLFCVLSAHEMKAIVIEDRLMRKSIYYGNRKPIKSKECQAG